MSSTAIDEWDESFLSEAIGFLDEVEASRNTVDISQPQPNPNPHFSSTSNNRVHDQVPPWPSIPDFGPIVACGGGGDDVGSILSYSPPRELSQRVVERSESSFVPRVTQSMRNGGYGGRGGGKSNKKDKEIERLKEELDRVSKRLNVKEREYVELQKDRDKKDEQLKDAVCHIENKNAEIFKLKRIDLSYHPKDKDVLIDGQSAIVELKNRIMIDNGLTSSNGITGQGDGFPKTTAQSKRSRTISIQTDIGEDGNLGNEKAMPSVVHDLSSKLHVIWGIPGDNMLGRNLISELLITCSKDFCVLFKCMSFPSHAALDCWPNRSIPDLSLYENLQSSQFVDAAKVSRLYELLMKVRHEVVPLQTLLEPLLDLCTLENVTIAHKSLHILHAILQLMGCRTRLDRRNNVQVDQCQKSNFLEGTGTLQEKHNKSETSTMRSFHLENLHEIEHRMLTSGIHLSFDMLALSFEKMQQIAHSKAEECIQVEAISIMNLILMASNPSQREKFGLLQMFQSLPQLLRKEVGLSVRKHAVRLLFLLLNCPQMLSVFSNCQSDDTEHAQETDGLIATPTLQEGIHCILEGLAECLASGGTDTQEFKVQRNIIIILAFIASAGKSGFDVLLYPVTPQRVNFLELIIRVLASEMDAGTADQAKRQTFWKERTSLVREALILLNRLASNPTYSKVTLGVLTSNATASLTIDVATRMSKKSRRPYDSTKKLQVEDEIFDLARLFKSRVFTFLGESSQ